MKKDTVILALALLVIVLLFGQSRGPHPEIQDTTAVMRPADFPVWSPPVAGQRGTESRLYAPCPITPWALPRQSKEHLV